MVFIVQIEQKNDARMDGEIQLYAIFRSEISLFAIAKATGAMTKQYGNRPFGPRKWRNRYVITPHAAPEMSQPPLILTCILAKLPIRAP